MLSDPEQSVALSPEMAQLAHELVKSGQFSSAAEAVHGALLLLRDQPLDDVADIAELRQDVAVGLAQRDAGLGEPWDVEAVKDRLRARASGERGAG